MDWIWRNGVRVVKNIITAACIVASAPFVVPPLAIATTIALISSIPYCFLWVSYVCIEKLMRTLLPASAFQERDDKMLILPNKIGQGYIYDDEGIARVAMIEPVRTKEVGTHVLAFREKDRTPLRVKTIEDEIMRKESKSLLESIRDDTRKSQSLDRVIYRKGFERKDKELIVRNDAESVNIGGGRKHVSRTRHEGGLFKYKCSL